MFSGRLPSDFGENAVARALRRRSRPYIDLTASNPTAAGLSPSDEEIFFALRQPGIGVYKPDPRGLLSARRAVAAEYALQGIDVDPERIFLAASTSEAYAYLFKLLCDPGDSVLVPEPSYPLFDHLTALEGIRKRPYRLARRDSGEWEIDAASVGEGIESGVRALLLVHPNNPTGSYVKSSEMSAIGRFLDSSAHAVISDEVFFGFRLRETSQEALGVAAAREPAVLTFSLSGLSKSCALPQMKLAWILVGGPAEVADRAIQRLELIADTYLSVSTPVALALPELLRVGRSSSARIRKRLIENLRSAKDVFGESYSGHGVRMLPPEGGWCLPMELPPDRDDERCVLDLLEAKDVLVSPGWFFEFEGAPHLVLSLLASPEDFRDAMTRISDYFRAGKP